MTDDRSVFQLMSELIAEQGISCVLIGGFAVNFHKVSRQTGDIDFLITEEDFAKISGILEKSGYEKVSGGDTFVHFKSKRLPLMNMDFMFIDKDVIKKMMGEGEKLKIGRYKFTVVSLNHLIALKLHSIKHNFKLRFTKDFPDIINLIRVNGVNIKDKSFKELCLKYGTQEIYKKIEEFAK